MSTRLFLRYIPQPGSARRYYDSETGQTISRRAFLKLLNIIPEHQALARRSSGFVPRRKRRCDAGMRRSVLLWAHARMVKYANRSAQVVPFSGGYPSVLARRFAVVIDNVVAARVHLLPGRGTHHAVWRCSCGQKCENKVDLVGHVAVLHLRGVGAAAIPYPGYVAAHERRARMPWRVEAPE
jgi:hypothetical protein